MRTMCSIEYQDNRLIRLILVQTAFALRAFPGEQRLNTDRKTKIKPRMQNVYFISGLGADKRAFQFLELGFCNPVFVDWIIPLPAESISDYATRLKEQIHDEEPVIVGLSFGGIIALEIAKKFPVKKVVLLSSAKTEGEIPFYFRFFRYFPIHRAMSASFLRSANQFVYRCMGLVERKDKLIFREMMKEADDHFILWAIDKVIHWKNKSNSGNIVHIHGTDDILLPYRYVKAQHTVAGGEHLMTLLKADVISNLLEEVITMEVAGTHGNLHPGKKSQL